MQSYPLSLNGSVPATSIGVDADLFVYESGENGLRKNLLTYSDQFENAAWIKQGAATVVANADNTNTMEELSDPGGTAAYIYQNAITSANKVYTFSTYMKAGTSPFSRIYIVNAALTVIIAGLNITWTGGVPTIDYNTPGMNLSVVDAGDSIYRITLTFNSGIYTSLSTLIYSDPNGTRNVYLRDAQLEEGPKATKTIKSVATPGTSTDGDTRILVKPENGAEIILKPGQRFRIVEKASRWFVRSYDSISPINGSVIIGSGEFEDSNTANTFKLDGTFTNSVNVNNTPAQRIPVTLDTTQVLNIAGTTVQYTNSFADTNTADQTAQVVFSPASNPNGAYVELIEVSILESNGTSNQTGITFVAKSSAPSTQIDGDVIFALETPEYQGTAKRSINEKQSIRIKIPAGKGLYYTQASTTFAPSKVKKTVLYTLL